MDKQVLAALKKSIEHWEENAKNDDKPLYFGGGFCALCRYCIQCSICPVALKTGWPSCGRTPWANIRMHALEVHSKDRNYCVNTKCPTCIKLAKKELAFLKSLLPKKGKPTSR